MSDKDINDIWEGDLLGRKDDGIYLQRFIENSYRMDIAHQNSFVLNINSEWGSGKTWFLERFAKQLKQNHPVVYFDAWRNDFTQDPLTSLIAVICQSMEEQFARDLNAKKKLEVVKENALKFIKPSLPVVLAALVKHYTGLALLGEDTEEGEVDAVRSDSEGSLVQDLSSSLTKIAASEAMDDFYKEKKGIEQFIEALQSFVSHIDSVSTKSNLPICIFIDELDRCRPTYAIELLEAVKHIFSIGGLFFVIATDSKQLAHSINAVYGENFNSLAYLKRFFYTEYSLSSVDHKKMAKHLFSGMDFNGKVYFPDSYKNMVGFDGYFALNSDFFDLTPREQEQIFINFKNCVLLADESVIHYAYILFLLSLKLKHESVYEALMRNKSSQIFAEFMQSKGEGASAAGLSLGATDKSFGDLQTSKELNVKNIFNYYSGLRNKTYDQLLDNSPSRPFQVEIRKQFEKERSLSNKSYDEIISISNYFILITQAGRLIAKA